jgi:hypothetical protein
MHVISIIRMNIIIRPVPKSTRMIETVRNNTYRNMLIFFIVAAISLSILTTNIFVNSAMARDTQLVPFLRSPLRPYGAAHGQPISSPGLFATLEVTMKVVGGRNQPSAFIMTVSGNSPSLGSFLGSSSGTIVTLKPGTYHVTASRFSGYTTGYSSGCYGIARGGMSIKCTVTNQYTHSSK